MSYNPIYLTDYYKIGHKDQYPEGTSLIFSNFTPRKSRMENVNHSVFFGLGYFLKKYLEVEFHNGFFNQNPEYLVIQYNLFMKQTLGSDHNYRHIYDLAKLGYLPLAIYALPEGSVVPSNVPALVMYNTHPDFYWLPNYLETLMSCTLWQACTSATIARQYRLLLDKFAAETSDMPDFVDYQAHDFSFRGMSSVESAIISGMAHLQYFKGTDTIPAVIAAEDYYDREIDICSVPASEHSIMSAGGQEDEYATYSRLLDLYPTGILSVVSDTWDLWRVITDILPRLKEKIMARNGKLVIRPDSGDPVDIICGNWDGHEAISVQSKGVVELLWDIFGGTINSKGFKQLDSHIGVIYGDSITIERCYHICERLKAKGFASTNIVFGIGSFCVESSTPILCADLVWRKAADLIEGQEIIAFDENPEFGEGKHAARRYKTAKIEWNKPALKQCITLTTDIGKPITASDDHPWLVWAKNRNPNNMYFDEIGNQSDPRCAGLIWKKTSELVVGDKIAFLGNPWKEENTKDAGWLAGIYDGEGCYSKCTGEERIPHWKINISQNEGVILDRLRNELKNRNFNFYENTRDCPQLILTGGWYENLRFLGTIKPLRLMDKFSESINKLPALSRTRTYHLAEITSLKLVGTQEVASIKTSCGTFITNGYLSHNTYQFNTRDTLGWAMKSTYAEINGVGRPITKDPITDDGTKKSHSGLLKVIAVGGSMKQDGYVSKSYQVLQDQTWDQFHECDNELKLVYKDGKIL